MSLTSLSARRKAAFCSSVKTRPCPLLRFPTVYMYTCEDKDASPVSQEKTSTRVDVVRHAFPVAGKRQVFSDDENNVLREELRKYMDEHEHTQTAMAELLDIKQQNVGRLKNTKSYPHTGFNRDTANRLADLLGYRDAEELLIARGALADMKQLPSGNAWHNRDFAVRLARSLKYHPAAIDAVLARYTGSEYRSKPARWWVDRISAEHPVHAEAVEEKPTGKIARHPRSGTDG